MAILGNIDFLLLLSLLGLASTTNIDSFSFYDSDTYDYVNSSLAYNWKSGYPQSCECVETNVVSSKCKLFKCTCSCDKTAGHCDYSCCCDPDCSQSQIARFSSQNYCAEEGYTPDTETVCYSSSELSKVNPRGSSVNGKSTSAEGLNKLLCVEKTNNAYKGLYYEEASLQSAKIFDTNAGQKTYDYEYESESMTYDLYYDQNDTMRAYLQIDSGSYVALGNGYLNIPKTDFSGYCNDNNYATFENDIDEQQCIRDMSNVDNIELFISQCTNELSIQNRISNVFIASNPPKDATSSPTSYVSIILNTIYFESDDGNIVNITSIWNDNNCSTFYDSGVSNLTSCYFGLINNTGTMCRNVVKSVQYLVTHKNDKASTITNVSASVTIKNMAYDESTGSEDLLQSYSIYYDSEIAADVSTTNGNIVKRFRSGNPGYLLGSPVLFGTLNDEDVIEEYVDGLEIATANTVSDTTSSNFGSTLCPSELTSSLMSNAPIKFGFDMTSGCILQLNRSQLRSFCCEGSDLCDGNYVSEYSSSDGVPIFLARQKGYTGIYGNADPLDKSQWLSLTEYTADTGSRRWTESSSTCSSMITGLNYKFLVAYTGEKENPQNKIIAASAEYTQSDWKMRVPYTDEVTKQTFPLQITVTFVYTNEEKLKGYTPPPQPILLSVPYDVFYPFNTNNARSSAGPTSVLIVLFVSFFCVFMVALI